MRPTPVVSVLLPVHDAEAYLADALRSILQQDFAGFEVVAVDDGSRDRSCEILEASARQDPRVVVLRSERRGLVETLATGFERCRGDLIARMDADDIALRSRFRRQVAFLSQHRECVLVGSAVVETDPEGRDLKVHRVPCKHEEIEAGLFKRDGANPVPILHPTVMMRRAAAAAAGGYRPAIKASEDRDLWLRLAERGRLANLPQILLRYRLHSKSFTSTHSRRQQEFAHRVIREAYARRGISWNGRLEEGPVVADAAPPLAWARHALAGGNFGTARHHSWAAVRRDPASLATWRVFGRALTGAPGLALHRWIRGRWPAIGKSS